MPSTASSDQQTCLDPSDQLFSSIDTLPGCAWSALAEPVPEGSIHRLKMQQDTVIPSHTHPCDEYVFVISGTFQTGDRVCEAGSFLKTPANVRQGPHRALTDVELLTIRLGPMGGFDATLDS